MMITVVQTGDMGVELFHRLTIGHAKGFSTRTKRDTTECFRHEGVRTYVAMVNGLPRILGRSMRLAFVGLLLDAQSGNLHTNPLVFPACDRVEVHKVETR